MRVAVSEQGYAGAVVELVAANQYAAYLAEAHADRLRGTAAMAGDDSTAEEFAASYDTAAAESLAALASLVDAFAALGRLVEASLANHATADARAALPDRARPSLGRPTPDRPTPDRPTLAEQAVGVRISAPPSSLGTDQSPPGGLTGLVLDQLQDVFWPNADTGRVRAAGTAWRTTAEALDLLRDHLDRARTTLEPERSPEIPLALSVLTQLRTRLTELADQLTALGTACTDYADHVETKRGELLDLLEDLVLELGFTALAGGALSFFSGGAAATAAGSLGASRLASAASRARSILDSLRLLTAGTALRARPVTTTAGEVAASASRISRARVMLMEAGGAAPRRARTKAFESPTAWIERQRRAGGHLDAKHVGVSDRSLRLRLLREPDIKGASTFVDAPTAHRAIQALLARRRADVEAWLASGKRSLPLEESLDAVTGRTMLRSGDVVEVNGIFAKLVRDPTQPEGFYIRTAFPKKVMP